MANHNGLAGKVALAVGIVGVVGALIGVGINVGSLTTLVAVQNQEITRLRVAVDSQRMDIQSLELYVRELHMNLGPMPRLDQPLPSR